MKKILFILAATIVLAGCNEEANALRANPQVSDIGVFDGCSVKFVDRGYQVLSFYIATCSDGAVTLTSNYTVKQGKSDVPQRNTTIIKKIQEEEQALDAKKKALAKLSVEERKQLGLE